MVSLPEAVLAAVEEQQVPALRRHGTADEGDAAAALGEAGMSDAERIGGGAFLAHEGAGRTGDAVDDGDVACQQVRKLGQEKGGAEAGGQHLVQPGAINRLGQFGIHLLVQRQVALAAAGGDDQVHVVHQGAGVRIVDGKTGGIGAQALPGLHLALVTLLGDLPIERQGRQGVDRPRGVARVIHHGRGTRG